MAIKLITYDLNNPNTDYKSLHEKIKSLGDYIKPLKSVWLVKTDLPSEVILDKLKTGTDRIDDFIIAPFNFNHSSEYAVYLKKEYVDWIERAL